MGKLYVIIFILFALCGCGVMPKQDVNLCATDKILIPAVEGLASGGAGFVRNGLAIPLKNKYPDKVEYVSFEWTDTEGLAKCIKDAKGIVIPVGHSFGGQTVYNVMTANRDLAKKVYAVVTVDPRMGPYTKPASVIKWKNFYELVPLQLNGRVVEGADNERLYVGHTQMPYQPQVFKHMEKLIGEVK